MKIYANNGYDEEWEFLKAIAGQDIWVRAIVALDGGYDDCYIKVINNVGDPLFNNRIAVQAQDYNKPFGKGWHSEMVYFVYSYQVDIMEPTLLYTTEELKEELSRV